jgi:cell division protease FtsH
MKQQHKLSLGYYLLVFFLIILLESIFFSGAAVKEISYSRFRNLLAYNKIQSVIVETDRIFGLEKIPVDVGGSASNESPRINTKRKSDTCRWSPSVSAGWSAAASLRYWGFPCR